MSYIYKVGVAGAGLMGAGIAQVVSYAGIPVVLRDINQPALDKGLSAIRDVYKTRIAKGRMTPEQMDQKMALVATTTQLADFADCDLVIEAVPEDLDLKKALFAELSKICSPSAIFASNTSALSITEMGKAGGRPDKTIGLHFFYPAPVMKLIEIIPTEATAQETIDTCVSFVESIRKLAVRVKECAGFLVNRLLMPYVGQAIWCYQVGLAGKKEIDDAMVKFGMPMGPFLLTDTLGIDVCYKVALVLEVAYGERAKPPHLLKQLYDEHRFGLKTGAGFYSYSDQPEFRAPPAAMEGTFTPERLLFPMVNEAAFCLEEAIASPGDIDLSMLAGTGFPQATQGLLHYADDVGLDVVLAKLKEWNHKPAAFLERKVAAGQAGKKSKAGFFEYT